MPNSLSTSNVLILELNFEVCSSDRIGLKKSVRTQFDGHTNVIDGYFDHYGYFDHPKTLNFTISPRRRYRRRRQYEIIQKICNETSLSIAKIYSLIISIQNKQSSRIFVSLLS